MMKSSVFPTAFVARLAALLMLAALPLSAQESVSPFSLHGYLTQAYGVAERSMVLGLTRDGTADYGRAALLARYTMSPSDHFVVQLAHRRLGDSPTMKLENDVTLDMLFYEHRFASGIDVRVGRIALPFGIYNEVRYTGTLTPFYRAPYVIYRDGTYSSETIDGASLAHLFRAGRSWETSVEAYGGGFEQLEFGAVYPPASAPYYDGAVIKSKNVVGGQLWLATPIEGLRLGASARQQKDFGGIYERPGGATTRTWATSLDGSFDRWLFRSELNKQNTAGFAGTAYYAQTGVRVLSWLGLNVQGEVRNEQLRYTPTGPWIDVKAGRDNAVGVNFYPSGNTVFKLEAHAAKGYGFMFEQIVDTNGPPLEATYAIGSFSVSF